MNSPAITPHIKQDMMRTARAVRPSAMLYMMSCGLRSIELIMKAASQSSFIPLPEKEAAIGIVPYIHRGEAIPRILAGITPNAPNLLFFKAPNN